MMIDISIYCVHNVVEIACIMSNMHELASRYQLKSSVRSARKTSSLGPVYEFVRT